MGTCIPLALALLGNANLSFLLSTLHQFKIFLNVIAYFAHNKLCYS